MIVKVLSSLKHNGTKHKVGDEFDLDSKYVDQLKGIVEVVDGEATSENGNLENKTRKSLDKIAKSAGIKNPENLNNKQEVIDAIEDAQDEDSDEDENSEENV